MFRPWFLLLVAIILAPCTLANWSAQPQGTNYAFLVGCSKYQKAEFHTLPFTGNDVLGFRAALKTTNFDDDHMVVLHDGTKEPNRYLPNKANILHELDLLLGSTKKNDTLVVALSGHGVQFKGDPVSYFVPVDGRVADKTTLIALDGKGGLYDRIDKCAATKKLLIVNACRNDPAANVDFATSKVELVDEDRKQEVPEGIAAIYSCRAGQLSYYDPDRKVALFFDHVIRAWKGEYTKDGKVTLEKFFLQVEDKTATDARKLFSRSQVPLVMRNYKGSWEISTARPADTASNKPAKDKAKSLNKKPVTLAKEITNSLGMKLRRIDAGTFTMGSPKSDKLYREDEDEHEVEITQPFHIGVFEVTQAEYEKVMGTNPSWFSAKGSGKDKVAGQNTQGFPVERVSWLDAMEFCKKLTALKEEKVHGRFYDLPTEAEWEFACRSGSKVYQIYQFGDSLTKNEANIHTGLGRTAKVGSYQASAFGLYDMHGNVWEWCRDWYDGNYYVTSPKSDPPGPESGKYRVLRGGSWDIGGPVNGRSASRRSLVPGGRVNDIGFRVVLRQDPRTP